MTVWLVWCLVLLLLSLLFSTCLRRMMYMIPWCYTCSRSSCGSTKCLNDPRWQTRTPQMRNHARLWWLPMPILGHNCLRLGRVVIQWRCLVNSQSRTACFEFVSPLKVRWFSNLRQYSGLLWRVSFGSMGLGTCSMECIPFWTCFLEQRHRREVLLGKIQLFFPSLQKEAKQFRWRWAPEDILRWQVVLGV